MDILKLVETLPLFWKLIMIFLVILINGVYLFRKQISNSKFIKKISSIFNIKKLILKEHKLFQEVKYLQYKINLIHLADVNKSKIFKNLLLMKYNTIVKHSHILLATKGIYDLSENQLYALIVKNMIEIVDEYNNEFKLKYGEDIYALVMLDSEKGFNSIHQKTIEFIKNAIEETFESKHVKYTNADKLDFLFDLYYIAIKLAISDVEKVYRNFNGDLDILIEKT
jgi:hypothetical protein